MATVTQLKLVQLAQQGVPLTHEMLAAMHFEAAAPHLIRGAEELRKAGSLSRSLEAVVDVLTEQYRRQIAQAEAVVPQKVGA